MRYLQTGFTFLEIITALCLLSLGLLGFVRLDVLNLHIHYLAYQESVAASQIVSMIQRLKANYLKRSEELVSWNEQNKMVLPRGKGGLICSEYTCRIHLKWRYQGEKSLFQTVQIQKF